MSALRLMIVTLWLGVGLGTWSWLGPAWLAAMRPHNNQVVDFYQDWGSAHNYWSGLPIYTPHSISIPRYLGLPSNPIPCIEYNIHPPTSVLLALPLGILTYPDAALVWNIISIGAVLASVVVVAMTLPNSKALIVPGVVLLPLCHPLYGNFYQGQLNLFLVLLVTGMWALERAGRYRLAGLVLGLAATIKLFPIYLAIYYISQGRARLLWAALVSVLTLTSITAFLLGLDTYYDYMAIVLPWNAEFRMLGYNLSIAGLWHKLFYPVPGEQIIPLWSSLAIARWGTLCSDLIITAIVVVAARRACTPAQCDFAFAATATGMLLVSPVTWDTSLPILLVPFTLIALSPVITRSLWLSAALLTITMVNFVPHHILIELMSVNCSSSGYSSMFMLWVPSLKFYMLLGIFLLGLTAYRLEASKAQLKLPGGGTTT
jgi:alpha-1,2-mannosyltransferase